VDLNSSANEGIASKADKAKLRSKFLRRLPAFSYEDQKNRNPKRAADTCEWFTTHHLFRNWQDQASALLWVSADPGCGKSVLARYLIDDIVSSNASRTTCYFFFKDDFDDQKALEGALGCLLRQLFDQDPDLLSEELLGIFERKGNQVFSSVRELWTLLKRGRQSP
jgi:hypothetical protein